MATENENISVIGRSEANSLALILRFKDFNCDWSKMRLGEVCEKIQDGNYGGLYPKAEEFMDFGIPFLTSKALGGDGFIKEDKID